MYELTNKLHHQIWNMDRLHLRRRLRYSTRWPEVVWTALSPVAVAAISHKVVA